jgi:transcriptional regulator with XRE-family HTH domain
MITAHQLRAARALLSIDQRQMAELADLSVPTIQRMEASDGVIRANVDSLMKLVSALESAGIELINPGAASATGGRGVRLREHVTNPKTAPKATPKISSKSKSKTVRQPKRVLERVR